MSNLPKKGEQYRHYKGDIYEVISIVRHTETSDLLVNYKPVSYESNWLKEFNCESCVRPLDMFMADVETDSYSGPRFVKVN